MCDRPGVGGRRGGVSVQRSGEQYLEKPWPEVPLQVRVGPRLCFPGRRETFTTSPIRLLLAVTHSSQFFGLWPPLLSGIQSAVGCDGENIGFGV